VELYGDGGDFFPAMLEAFCNASRYIHIEFYLIRNDAIGRAFATALLAAVERGVEVFLLYDYMGCFDTPSAYFKHLEKGGVHCLPFNPPPFRRGIAWFDKRDHRKVAVIDGETAFVCGLNIGNEYAGIEEGVRRWRDIGVSIDGPAVTVLEGLFRESWQDEGGGVSRYPVDPGVTPTGAAGVLVVSGGPHHNRSFIRSAFRMAMAGATESIRIVNPYFIPGPRVIRSLLRAAGRGVHVQLILPARSDVRLVQLVSRSSYAPLLRAGIEIYERQEAVLHAKLMLIDNCWAVIGSANLDHRSFHRNYEVNVIVDSQEFGDQVAGLFAADLARSRRVDLDEHERRGLVARLIERLFSTVSWLL
jgi:cardiolipin synthase